MNALVTSSDGMYPLCSLCNIGFRMLVKYQIFAVGESPSASVDFVLPDLQSNITDVGDDKDSNEDFFDCDGLEIK